MSSSVSQLEFWREASSDKNEKNADEGGPGAAYLSYNVLMGLSFLGGFFALDHLYIRSPITFLAKIIINFFCFGIWWIYDATQIIFNSHAVKIFGLGVPGLGPQGIAAGVFANPVADKKHMIFFIYSLCLLLGGAFGLDSFIMGDNRTGFIRLICLFSVILAPVALGWWIYKLFNFFVYTKDVISETADFFGAPAHSFEKGFLSKFPFLTALFSPLETIKNFFNDLIGDAIQPITDTAQMAIGTIDTAVKVVDNTVQLGREAISKGADIASQISNTVEKVSQATQIMPGVSLYSSITPGSVQKELGQGTSANAGNKAANATATAMVGGAMMMDLKPVHYILLVTIVTIVLGGVIVTYHRSKNVPVQDERDDTPPQPGVLRKPDQKERTT